jgi:hypothetical protein
LTLSHLTSHPKITTRCVLGLEPLLMNKVSQDVIPIIQVRATP